VNKARYHQAKRRRFVPDAQQTTVCGRYIAIHNICNNITATKRCIFDSTRVQVGDVSMAALWQHFGLSHVSIQANG
jgi:hypothetical protein